MELRQLETDERRLTGVEIPARFRAAAIFGIDYALARARYHGGWEATVTSFESHAIDTSVELVALTTAQAVMDALHFAERLTVDAEQGVVSFSKS